jgi:hypothetical protein
VSRRPALKNAGLQLPDQGHRSDKIDAAVALAMAIDRIENRPEPARLVGWL